MFDSVTCVDHRLKLIMFDVSPELPWLGESQCQVRQMSLAEAYLARFAEVAELGGLPNQSSFFFLLSSSFVLNGCF